MASGVRLLVVGRPGVWHDGREVPLGHPDRTAVLAALVVARGRSVPTADLAALLWGAEPPVAPSAGVRSHVLALEAVLRARGSAALVTRTDDGWRLDAPRDHVDAEVLADLVREGREHLDAERFGDARAAFEEALGFVLERPLDGLDAPSWEPHRRRVEDHQARAFSGYADACLGLGLPDETVEPLRTALAQARLTGYVGLWQRLAVARARSGRLDEALRVLDEAQRTVGHDASAGASLRALQEHLVDADPRAMDVLRVKAFGLPTVPTPPADRPVTSVPTVVMARPPAPTPPVMRWTVFGTHLVRRGQSLVTVVERTQRALLAVLLVRVGQEVPLEDLVAVAWPGDRPARPDVAVDAYLGRLAEVLRPDGLPVVRAGGPTWRLDLPATSVDLGRARHLVARSGWTGVPAERADLLREAVGLTQGVPLGGLDGRWADGVRAQLVPWQAEVRERCAVAEADCGRHVAALPLLADLVESQPLREDLWERYLAALVAAGRHRDAAIAYDRAAAALHRALGTGPGPALQAVRRTVEPA